MCVFFFVCLSVFQWHCKSPNSGGQTKFWLKVLAPVFKKKFLNFVKHLNWCLLVKNCIKKLKFIFCCFCTLVRLFVRPPLLSALVKRFSVFRMQDFLSCNYFWTQKIFCHNNLIKKKMVTKFVFFVLYIFC